MNPVVIVTRPAAAGERLHGRLIASGWDAVWCPAFDLGAAPDARAASTALQYLQRFDLVVFVSPNAVRASLPLVEKPWPTQVAIGAVGEATAAAVRAELALAPGTALIAPAGDAAGSEAFWAAWLDSGKSARRVLILRAQHGREWLAERFSEAGARSKSCRCTRAPNTASTRRPGPFCNRRWPNSGRRSQYSAVARRSMRSIASCPPRTARCSGCAMAARLRRMNASVSVCWMLATSASK